MSRESTAPASRQWRSSTLGRLVATVVIANAVLGASAGCTAAMATVSRPHALPAPSAPAVTTCDSRGIIASVEGARTSVGLLGCAAGLSTQTPPVAITIRAGQWVYLSTGQQSKPLGGVTSSRPGAVSISRETLRGVAPGTSLIHVASGVDCNSATAPAPATSCTLLEVHVTK